MEKPLINRVAESGIITLNLEDYYPSSTIDEFDLTNFLFQGLILKEKDFRQALKEHDWSSYDDKIICVYCSTDAIIPVWAFMLVTSYLSPVAKEIFTGSKEAYLAHHYKKALSNLEASKYDNARIVIKGCSNLPVPASAYAELTQLLRPFAKSIMYGEPCSTVPIYKKPLRRVR